MSTRNDEATRPLYVVLPHSFADAAEAKAQQRGQPLPESLIAAKRVDARICSERCKPLSRRRAKENDLAGSEKPEADGS